MNANEVLANVGLELAGRPKGDYAALDSARRPQHVAVDQRRVPDRAQGRLPARQRPARARGSGSSLPRSAPRPTPTSRRCKMGRTELQDAVPMTVGQELHAFAATLDAEAQNLLDAERALYAVNMGGTAIGTGLNAPKGYAAACARELAASDRQADRPGRRPDRRDLEPAGLRGLLGRAPRPRGHALEDRERLDPARLGTARAASASSACRRCSPARRSCPAR